MTKKYSHSNLDHKKQAVQKINSGALETSFDSEVITLKTKIQEK